MTAAEPFSAWIEGLTREEQARVVAALPLEEARSADADWAGWAHRGQSEPEGAWSTWVIKAGRGFGKTRAGAEWIAGLVRASRRDGGGFPDGAGTGAGAGETLRIALVAATLEEARRVMVEGRSGLLEVAADEIADWAPSLRRLRFRGGAEATLFSGASPEALRGPEHHVAWCDELAKWRHAGQCWDMLQLGLRLGERPRALVTTTPRPGPVLQAIMASPGCTVTGGPSRANPHLPGAFLHQVHRLYRGTRLERQELEGELLAEAAGALWTVELIEKCRSDPVGERRAELRRVVIGVDPPAGDGTCGIVACALDREGRGHVLADHSVGARSPEGWARAVAAAAQVHKAQLAVAEANQGGRMVESVLRAASASLRVKLVHATEGKAARADPIATLFEAGRVTFAGRFPELEAELRGMIGGGGYEGPGPSPDRADAMVWALTELMLGKERAEPRVWGF